MTRRTKGEQRAYRDGYEMCGECIEKYLSEDGKKRLKALIVSVRNAVDIEDLPVSAEGEYIKKEPIAKELKEQEDFWRKKWKEHESTANFEDAHIAKAVMNLNKFYGLLLSNMPTYSFPEREKGEWIPVTERLPKEHQAVLCWAESTAERLDTEFIGMLDKGDWFLQSDANHLSFPHQYKVVAWMPLPEPYERGKADEL